LEYKVIHAGVIEDCLFPNNKQYTSYGFVDQTKLIEVYSQAHLLVLPSREEGLALVQVQALACGLNIVCSDRTGGADLRGMLDDKDMIAVVKAGSVVELREAIIKSMNMALNKEGLRNRSKTILNEQFSWKAYGNRYNQFLEGLFNKNIERKK
jgi:glycosyltransferase involved in cell wall biosynthesis